MTLDFSIHEKNLRRFALRKNDFTRYQEIQCPNQLQIILDKAVEIGQAGFKDIPLSNSVIGKKKTYKIKNLEIELVLRMISKNITRLTRVKQSNRVSIIKCMRSLLEEGVDYRVYKLDIKNFYESVLIEDIVQKLQKDGAFSRQSLSLLKSYEKFMSNGGIAHLPRGIALSATLSEYIMREFDRIIGLHPEVFFYARFVDDMVFITSGRENEEKFEKELASKLPNGLHFNCDKRRIITFLGEQKNGPNYHEINFLGYKITVHDMDKKTNPIRRKTTIDISKKKINKIKTRVIKSALQYCEDSDFATLLKRLQLLTANYSVFDQARGLKRKAGIYYNYSLLDIEESKALVELDSFLKKFILSSEGRLCSKLYSKLTNEQRRKILKLSFKRGFENRTFFNFSGSELARLMKCWNYE